MKIFFILVLCLAWSLVGFAQTYRGVVLGADAADTTQTEPLYSALVVWEGTQQGTTTDFDGSFSISANQQTSKLLIKYVGFISHTVDINSVADGNNIRVVLIPEQLDEVTIAQRKMSSSMNRHSPALTQDLGKDELCKAPCCNLGESFETNASVDVNYADATTGARTIQLLGLSGRYVQMLSENIPNLRGIAAPFGLSYVPGSWMDGISISKGVGTVVNGFEAFTGQINYEYKKPVSDERFSVSLFGSTAGRGEVNASTAIPLGHGVSTALIVSASKDFTSLDENGDNFRDEPQTRQLSLLNRWNFHRDNYTGQIVVKTMNEERRGGEMDFEGSVIDTTKYGVCIKTQRVESWLKNGFSFEDDLSLGIQASYIYHKQSSFFGRREYDGQQDSYYLNILMRKGWNEDQHIFDCGLSSQGDFFDERISFDASRGSSFYSLNDIAIGLYAQYTYNCDDVLTMIAGLRADYDTEFKAFVTPRLNIRYAPCQFTIIRGGVGVGSRTTALFAENNYMLSSARKWSYNEEDVYSQERAWNVGGSLQQTFGNSGLSATIEYFRTMFSRQLLLDTDISPREVWAHSALSRSYANTFQIEAVYRWRGLDVTAAWRWNEAYQELGGEMRQRPLSSRYKALISLSYQTPHKTWQFDVNMQLNGGGRVPTTDGNPDEYKRGNTFGSYRICNVQMTKWFNNWSLYAGCENVGNYMQDNAIIAADKPMSEYYDGTMIWGPLMSRKFYLGLRFAFSRS